VSKSVTPMAAATVVETAPAVQWHGGVAAPQHTHHHANHAAIAHCPLPVAIAYCLPTPTPTVAAAVETAPAARRHGHVTIFGLFLVYTAILKHSKRKNMYSYIDILKFSATEWKLNIEKHCLYPWYCEKGGVARVCQIGHCSRNGGTRMLNTVGI